MRRVRRACGEEKPGEGGGSKAALSKPKPSRSLTLPSSLTFFAYIMYCAHTAGGGGGGLADAGSGHTGGRGAQRVQRAKRV